MLNSDIAEFKKEFKINNDDVADSKRIKIKSSDVACSKRQEICFMRNTECQWVEYG